MALKNRSLILWGLQVTNLNSSIDFKNAFGGPEINATLTLGFYSLSSLIIEVARAMNAADPANVYSCSADRTAGAGLQNRTRISTNGAFLSLLFASGSRNATSCAALIGFTGDQTGALTYTGTATCGTALVPDFVAYNYLGPDMYRRVQGTVNISASGIKESVVFQIQQFVKAQFKYETQTKTISQWSPFWDWAIQQRSFDFTPDVTVPNTFYQVTMEKTPADGKAIGFEMKEMLPQFPDLYDTGLLEMRVVQS